MPADLSRSERIDASFERLEWRDAWLRAIAWTTALAPLATALVISFAVTPGDIESGRVVLGPRCALRALFGVECPTCGMTRAFTAIAHGQLGAALHYNAASPFAYLAFVVGAVIALRQLALAIADTRAASRALGSMT